MAVTGTVYNAFKAKIINGANINLASGGDTIKVALLTSSYTPDIDTHDFFDDVSANEISATGYTAGGYTLVSQTVTQDNTDNEAAADAADPTWTITTSASPRYAVIYKSTGTPSTSPLILYVDFGETFSISNGTLTLALNSEGYLNIT